MMARKAQSQDDPISTSLFAELLASVAEEMGAALMRAAFSPNIKERRDYSCALFLGDGTMVAQAAHIPVHLGSAPLSVAAVLDESDLEPGDEVILNDPFRGGTHLPDITLVKPVFMRGSRHPSFIVANRAHHADVGGASPGSMGIASDVYGEGFRIPPVHIRRKGKLVEDVMRLFRAQVRQPDEREGDLRAQMAANHVGEERLRSFVARHGLGAVRRGASALPRATEKAMRNALKGIPRGTFRFHDVMDDDGLGSGPLRIEVALRRTSRGILVDFTGTSPQTAGPVNANHAITLSAVGYALRCLLPRDIPTNGGVFRALELRVPPGSLVNADVPAATAAGNVETSQRIVDVVLGALARALPGRIPAASAGTMTNVSLGGRGYTYYETVAGGSGASPHNPGVAGVQTHMTNTLNTPIEVFERSVPLRVRRYEIRRGSGGSGARQGGNGLVRVLESLEVASVSVLADRQVSAPYGLRGGACGTRGRTEVYRRGGAIERWPAKAVGQLESGDRLVLRTPGGGGHGRGGTRS